MQNVMVNLEEMESIVGAIVNNREVLTTRTDKIADGIKKYCIDAYNELNEEKKKLVGFINSHKNLFYSFNKDEKYVFNRVKSSNCRYWGEKNASVYIGNIEINVNPQNGEAVGVTTILDFQYRNHLGVYRTDWCSSAWNENCKDIDYWVEMKKGVGHERENFSYVVKEFKKVLENLNNNEIIRCNNMVKCCKEIDDERNAVNTEIVITIKV